MKKMTRVLAMLLAVTLVLGVAAFAAGVGDNPAVTPIEGEAGVTATFDGTYSKLEVTYSNAKITMDGQYMIFVVTANKAGHYIPGEDTIIYINQEQAAADGSVSFSNVYPSSVTNSAIMISGTGFEGPKVIAEITVPYILGDVNGDDEIDTKDLTRLARYLAGATNDIVLDAANTNGEGGIDTKDLTRLARYLAGAATLG